MRYQKNVALFLMLLFLVGCGTLPPGNYLIVPVTGTLESPDYSYCSGNQCWYGQYWLSTPTAEEFPVPSPLPTSAEPTPTAPQPVYICPNGPSVNVRSDASLTASVLGQLYAGQRALMYTAYKDWYQVQFNVDQVGYIAKWVSSVCP